MKAKHLVSMVAGAAASCLLAFSLAGCSSGGDVKNASEPVPASQAFSEAGVWFESSDVPEKDEEIENIYVFDGSGNVTIYDTSGVTYGDLNGKSDDEVIELAKQKDQENAQAANDSNIARVEQNLEDLNDALDKERSGIDEMRESLAYYTDESEAAAYKKEIEEYEAEIEDQYGSELEESQAELDDLKNYSYTAPEPQAYSLHIETDGTGNYAQSETLTVGDDTLGISKRDMGWNVYDMYLLGYDGLYTIVEQGHHGFVLDEPGTEGVSVD